MTLKQEFEYYLNNKDKFHLQYNEKFIVLKENQVIGVFEDRFTAIQETNKNHPLGTFLVQQVSASGDHARFHSRVVF